MKDDERDALFARARSGAAPTDEDRRRVREKIGRRLAVAAGTTAGVTTSAKAAAMAAMPSTAASAISVGVVVKSAAVALALVAVGAGFRSVIHAPTPKAPTALVARSPIIVNPVPVPVPGPVLGPVPRPVAGPDPVPAAVRVPVAGPDPVPAAVPVPTSPVPPEQELALIQAMQLALRDGDPQRALSLVREHELRFPSGVLTPEREGAKALALCAQFPPSEAAKVGRAFLDTHPRSPLAARVESACALTPR